MKVENTQIWSKQRPSNNGWANSGSWWWYDIAWTGPHSRDQVYVYAWTNIGQNMNDEGWGVQDIRIYTDSESIIYPL